MRTVLALLLLFSTRPCFAQSAVAGALPHLAYSGTDSVADVSPADLVARVQAWARHHSSAAQPAAGAPTQAIVQGAEDMVYPKDGVVLHQPLHYTLTLVVQGSSYHYRLTDFVLETSDPLSASARAFLPIEPLLVQAPTTDAERAQHYLLRTAFEEATAQLLGGLQYDLGHPVPLAAEDK